MIHPAGAIISDSFWRQDWSKPEHVAFATCNGTSAKCDAFVVSVIPDGSPQIMLLNYMHMELFRQAADQTWQALGSFTMSYRCPEKIKKALSDGAFNFALAQYPDMVIAGRRFSFEPTIEMENNCK